MSEQAKINELIWGFSTVKETCEIASVPHWQAILPIKVNANSRVGIIGRDIFFRWINIVYTSQGKHVYGWVHYDKLSDFTDFDGNHLLSYHMPLTEFQLNKRNEIQGLSGMILTFSYRYDWSRFNIIMLLLSIFVIPVTPLVAISIITNTEVLSDLSLAAGVGMFWMFLIIGVFIMIKRITNGGKKKHRLDYLTEKERNEWAKYVQDYLKRTEKTSDKIGQFLGALGAFAVVAGTAVVAATVAQAANEQNKQTQQKAQPISYTPSQLPQTSKVAPSPQKVWVKCSKCNGEGNVWKTVTSYPNGYHKDAAVRAHLGMDEKKENVLATCDACNGQKGSYK